MSRLRQVAAGRHVANKLTGKPKGALAEDGAAVNAQTNRARLVECRAANIAQLVNSFTMVVFPLWLFRNGALGTHFLMMPLINRIWSARTSSSCLAKITVR
jgi:hypothetical protein